jgi:hypothetical protein
MSHRLEALKIAVIGAPANYDPVWVVKRAQVFEAYLSGAGQPADAAQPEATNDMFSQDRNNPSRARRSSK